MYVDESGFEENVYRSHGLSMRGKRCFGDRPGTRSKRTNLIAAKRKGELLAPVLYEGTTTAAWFNEWLENHLMKELKVKSTLIMDNAAFHKKSEITEIANQAGHNVLFLPPYSPDLNPIEKVFAVLKKRRTFAPENTSIDDIVKEYANFLE